MRRLGYTTTQKATKAALSMFTSMSHANKDVRAAEGAAGHGWNTSCR